MFNQKFLSGESINEAVSKSLLGDAEVAVTTLFPVFRFNLQRSEVGTAGFRDEILVLTSLLDLFAFGQPRVSLDGTTTSC